MTKFAKRMLLNFLRLSITCDTMAHTDVFQCPSNIPSDYKEIIFDTLCKMKDHVEARGPRYGEQILFQSRYYIHSHYCRNKSTFFLAISGIWMILKLVRL